MFAIFGRIFTRREMPSIRAKSGGALTHVILPGVIATAFVRFFWRQPYGWSFKVTFVPAMVLAYVCHLLTTAREMPNPKKALPPYLLALALQQLHFAEEFLTHFNERWPQEIFHAQPMPLRKWILVNLVSNTAFTLGAIALYRGIRLPMLVVWFFTVMGVLGNAIQHPIYCLKVRGYFPGFYTSLLYWILGPVVFRSLWHVGKEQ
jgi:hypothetical protein